MHDGRGTTGGFTRQACCVTFVALTVAACAKILQGTLERRPRHEKACKEILSGCWISKSMFSVGADCYGCVCVCLQRALFLGAI